MSLIKVTYILTDEDVPESITDATELVEHFEGLGWTANTNIDKSDSDAYMVAADAVEEAANMGVGEVLFVQDPNEYNYVFVFFR